MAHFVMHDPYVVPNHFQLPSYYYSPARPPMTSLPTQLPLQKIGGSVGQSQGHSSFSMVDSPHPISIQSSREHSSNSNHSYESNSIQLDPPQTIKTEQPMMNLDEKTMNNSSDREDEAAVSILHQLELNYHSPRSPQSPQSSRKTKSGSITSNTSATHSTSSATPNGHRRKRISSITEAHFANEPALLSPYSSTSSSFGASNNTAPSFFNSTSNPNHLYSSSSSSTCSLNDFSPNSPSTPVDSGFISSTIHHGAGSHAHHSQTSSSTQPLPSSSQFSSSNRGSQVWPSSPITHSSVQDFQFGTPISAPTILPSFNGIHGKSSSASAALHNHNHIHHHNNHNQHLLRDSFDDTSIIIDPSWSSSSRSEIRGTHPHPSSAYSTSPSINSPSSSSSSIHAGLSHSNPSLTSSPPQSPRSPLTSSAPTSRNARPSYGVYGIHMDIPGGPQSPTSLKLKRRLARSRPDHQCPNCHTSESPLWRNCFIKGKILHLCNSCGLRYKKHKYCPHCYKVYYDAETNSIDWVQCSCCKNWAHRQCLSHDNVVIQPSYKCLRCLGLVPDS